MSTNRLFCLMRHFLIFAGMMIVLALLGACAAPATPAVAPTAVPAQPTAAPAKPTAVPMPLASPSVEPAVAQPTATTATATAVAGTFKVNGRSLLIKCMGSGSPVVVLEPSAGQTHFNVELIQQRFAAWTTTCAYDRAHTGGLRTAQDVVDDLHALLAAAKISRPFVLVGRDAGGLFVQLYAREFPEQVAGVVSLNPQPPAHPWLDEVHTVFDTQDYADEEAYYKGKNEESLDLLTSSDQLVAAAKPPKVPFDVFIGTEACKGDPTCLKSSAIYAKIESDVAAAWPHGSFSQLETNGLDVDYNHLDDIVAAAKAMVTTP